MNGISPWVGKLCLYLILCYVLTSGHYSWSCNLTGSYVLCQLFVKAEWIFQDDELIEWVEEKDSVVSRISDNTVFIPAKFQNNTVCVLPWKVSKQLSFSLSCRILTSHRVPGSGWSASRWHNKCMVCCFLGNSLHLDGYSPQAPFNIPITSAELFFIGPAEQFVHLFISHSAHIYIVIQCAV